MRGMYMYILVCIHIYVCTYAEIFQGNRAVHGGSSLRSKFPYMGLLRRVSENIKRTHITVHKSRNSKRSTSSQKIVTLRNMKDSWGARGLGFRIWGLGFRV